MVPLRVYTFSSWIPFRTTNFTIVECGVQHWPVAGSTGQDFTVDSSGGDMEDANMQPGRTFGMLELGQQLAGRPRGRGGL